MFQHTKGRFEPIVGEDFLAFLLFIFFCSEVLHFFAALKYANAVLEHAWAVLEHSNVVLEHTFVVLEHAYSGFLDK